MIKLTNHEGRGHVWLKADAIQIVQQHDTHASIRLGGSWVDVKEKAEEVLALMTEAL